MAAATPPAGNIEVTAAWTAAVRAAESVRDDALFSDPWAAALAGAEGQAWLAERSPESVLPIALRTRFFDDFLLGVLNDEGVRQVVIVAAGLDTRAYRLDLPGNTRLFEVDRAEVLERKQRLLDEAGAQPKCERIAVAADLSGDWEAALTGAGLDPGQPAVWLLEGVLVYLPEGEMVALLDRVVDAAAEGSSLGFDTINAEVLTSPLTLPWVEMQASEGAPWLGTINDPVRYLVRRKWKAKQAQFGEEQANFERWTLPVVPAEEHGVPRFWLVTARKPHTFKRAADAPVLLDLSKPIGAQDAPSPRRPRPR